MAASLQSRVQLLAILAIAFILVSVPLFYQVRADASESRETAKSTFLSKLFRNVAKDLNPPEDLQVEDAWEQWQQDHPDCGPECDPAADPDGDGMSNKDEVEQGRNPNCNEEKEGKEYCAGQPQQPPPDPDNGTQARQDILFIAPNGNTSAEGGSWRDTFTVASVQPNYDRWTISWRVDNFQGLNYDLRLLDADGQVVWSASRNVQFPVATSDEDAATLDGTRVPPSGADYTFDVASSAFQASWHVQIVGERDASA